MTSPPGASRRSAEALERDNQPPRVAVVAIWTDGENRSADELIADTLAQDGARARLVIVDATTRGCVPPVGEATVLRAPSLSRGECYRAVLEIVDEPFVALAIPGCRSFPHRLARSVEALIDGADLVTSDAFLTDDAGSPVDRASPGVMGDSPGPFWEAGVCLRREALRDISPTAFAPIELMLLRELSAKGRARNITEPAYSVSKARYEAAFPRSRVEASLATIQLGASAISVEATVSIAVTEQTAWGDTLRTLEGFCRQRLERDSLEIVVVDADPRGRTAERLAGLRFAVPLRVIRVWGGSALTLDQLHGTSRAVARGACFEAARAGDSPTENLVEQRLRAHRLGQSNRYGEARLVAIDVAPPELTVIVPTRNRARELGQLLDALAAQSLEPHRFEVIVIDDGSDEPIESWVRAYDYEFSLDLLRREGGGPGVARNRALEHARGAVVLLLNDDAVPDKDLLRGHLEAHRFASSPRAVLGTFALLPEHRTNSIGSYVEQTTALFAQPAMRPGVLYHGLSFCSGNLSVPADALRSVDGFDESLPYAGGEDSELGLRLERRLGMRVMFDPGLRCGHDHSLDARSILRRKRVLGWVVHRIQTKHGDLGLLPVPTWPPSSAEWENVAREIEEQGPDARRLAGEVDAICTHESETGVGPKFLQDIATVMPELERFATLCGALAAQRGELPIENSPRAALPSEPRPSPGSCASRDHAARPRP